MSITTEIRRLRTNVNNIRQNTSDILDAIANKGVTVPAGSTLDNCASLISSIPANGSTITSFTSKKFDKNTGSKIVDENLYIGGTLSNSTLDNEAVVAVGADFSQMGNGKVNAHFTDSPDVVIGDRTYKTTKIDGQIWLAENLEYLDSSITLAPSSMPATTPSAWYYENNQSKYGYSGKRYGLLYNGVAVRDILSQIPGWHVPTLAEWNHIGTGLGTSTYNGKSRLKSVTEWDDTSYNGINCYGLNVIPNGHINDSSTFIGIGWNCAIWTSSAVSGSSNYMVYFDKTTAYGTNNYNITTYGMAVRLVKD